MTKDWERGFAAGVLSALSVVEHGDGGYSTTYIEIVAACGLNDLIREAHRERDSQLKHLLYIKKHRTHRGRMARSPQREGQP